MALVKSADTALNTRLGQALGVADAYVLACGRVACARLVKIRVKGGFFQGSFQYLLRSLWGTGHALGFRASHYGKSTRALVHQVHDRMVELTDVGGLRVHLARWTAACHAFVRYEMVRAASESSIT